MKSINIHECSSKRLYFYHGYGWWLGVHLLGGHAPGHFQPVGWAFLIFLTHWGRVTHICVSKLTIIASDNGLSPGQRQAIVWTNAGILLIGPLGTNFSEILIEIPMFSFKKMHLKVSAVKWRTFCSSLNVLSATTRDVWIIPSFQIYGYVLNVEHISCVIMNCHGHQWVIPSFSQ